MSWRNECAPIIARIIAEHGREDLAETKRALNQAYPFGERAYWPYKVWLSEIHRQLGEPSRDKQTLELF